jgi:hypothetical protein
MRNKLGSICLGFILAIFIAATLLASYWGATTHSDKKVCKTQDYILTVVDDFAQTARVLVQSDNNFDPAVKQKFINHYNMRHRQIVARLQHSGCQSTPGSRKG